MSWPLIDSHCHFDFADFDADREAVWAAAQANGIGALLIPGYEPTQWPRAKRLCIDQPHWYYTVGLHPWAIESYMTAADQSIEATCFSLDTQLTKALHSNEGDNGQAVAVGECGLDRQLDIALELQIAFLRLQIGAANTHNKPIILHCVKAHNEMLQLLKACPPQCGGVLHAFSGSYEMAMQYWRRGIRLGVGGVITYSRAKQSREAILRMPLEALLLETDAPSMPLHGRQGGRNSPEYLHEVAQKLAVIRSESFEEIALKTSQNFYDLFSIARSK